MLPQQIKHFVEKFSKMPSIGPRQATRLAFYIVNSGKKEIDETIETLEDLKKMSVCEKCFFVFSPKDNDTKICEICQDEKRNNKIIALIEKETDLISLEQTRKFNGRYFIVGNLHKNGSLDSEQKNRLKILKADIEKELGGPSTGSGQGRADEIIIAINPTTYGDFNAVMLAKELKDYAKKITRLGRGIPTGGEIEFADEETLSNALERRI